jgi:hypothetical protein
MQGKFVVEKQNLQFKKNSTWSIGSDEGGGEVGEGSCRKARNGDWWWASHDGGEWECEYDADSRSRETYGGYSVD